MIGAWKDHDNRIRPHSFPGYLPPTPVTLQAIVRQLHTPAIFSGAVRCTSGSVKTLAISPLSFCTMLSGVPAGARSGVISPHWVVRCEC